MNEEYEHSIFNSPQPGFGPIEDNWLDIEEFFVESTPPDPHIAHIAPPSPSPPSDMFAYDLEVEPFVPLPQPAHEGSLFPAQEPSTPVVQKKAPKSIATKNVCFNICQKTIKVLQKDVYSLKVDQICQEKGISKETFLREMGKLKKNFTGPKALAMFVEEQSALSEAFRAFMKWFLREKYLRHCLSGEMKDKEAYIRYKNEVILVILE